ncbi:MAG TPA: gluconate 2-dehydrogenase subunit 3 family protein [Cyclobacteriaceae bacterium]|nr:gluconate 2-dehydrogenase subunit 3 family protein [Cyclobacteriaceae bacterium]
MDRRKYLKTLAVGSVGAGLLIQSCETEKPQTQQAAVTHTIDRTPAEIAREEKLRAETFFNEHEMATIAVLVDIIIPKDDVSGSATDAGVPDFIEFIVKDKPELKTPVRGGLRWLDVQCMKRYNKSFVDCNAEQRIEMIDEIAFPELAKPEMQQGVAFFNTMRDLTATGFFTSKIGIEDLGYVGNRPNQWDGVPQEVLDQYGLQYDERTLAESVKFDT